MIVFIVLVSYKNMSSHLPVGSINSIVLEWKIPDKLTSLINTWAKTKKKTIDQFKLTQQVNQLKEDIKATLLAFDPMSIVMDDMTARSEESKKPKETPRGTKTTDAYRRGANQIKAKNNQVSRLGMVDRTPSDLELS